MAGSSTELISFITAFAHSELDLKFERGNFFANA
jgi:hypothetical protein